MEKHVDYWVSQSDNDLPVAESLLENGHYTWCLFIGHLVLEKLLKAFYVKEHQKIAPRIHDLENQTGRPKNSKLLRRHGKKP